MFQARHGMCAVMCLLLCCVPNVVKMNIEDLEIIKIVQANPCLYVKDIKAYKNVDKKHCWEQVGAALTKQKTGEAVQKRWDSLRTMFMRAHRKRMQCCQTIVVFIRLFHIFSQIRPERMSYAVLYYYSTMYDYLYYY